MKSQRERTEGFNDCILIRSMSGGMVDCVAVHGAPCQGWTIYGKPQAEGWGILAHGRVVDADERRQATILKTKNEYYIYIHYYVLLQFITYIAERNEQDKNRQQF